MGIKTKFLSMGNTEAYFLYTRPNLTANGTVGSGDFAVTGSSAYSTATTYFKAMDGDSSTYWRPNANSATYTMYCSKPLRMTYITANFTGTSYVTEIVNVQGSSDNSNWTTITFSKQSSSTTTSYKYSLTNSNYYKYYKLTWSSTSKGKRVSEITWTAYYKITTYES